MTSVISFTVFSGAFRGETGELRLVPKVDLEGDVVKSTSTVLFN